MLEMECQLSGQQSWIYYLLEICMYCTGLYWTRLNVILKTTTSIPKFLLYDVIPHSLMITPFLPHSNSIQLLTKLLTFFLAAVTYFLIYKASVASANSDEFINDPRHPRFATGGKFIDLEKKD